MEDVKWLLRRCGLPILLLLIFVIAGVVCWGELHTEKQKVAEEVWEPPVEIENSEAETEEAENAETSTESAYWFIPQASDDLLTEEEKEQLQSTVLSAAESVREIYKDIVIADAPSYSSGIGEFTKEQRKAVVEQLGRTGLVSVEEDTAMQNHEAIEAFYADYLDGQDSMVTVFEVQRDGLIGAVTFIYRKGELQTYYISYTRLKEWKYTDKGWFCYELCVPEPPEVSEIVDGSSVIRIKPMTEEQREMSERLVLGLGYQGQNLLCSNWNTENMSELDYNGMFEYLYGMKYGEKFNSEDYPNGIPKEEFESLIMEYLPITAEQIREYAVFDEENHTYELSSFCARRKTE